MGRFPDGVSVIAGASLLDRLGATFDLLGLDDAARDAATDEAMSRAERAAVGDALALEVSAAQAAVEVARAAGTAPGTGLEAAALSSMSLRDREALALRDAGAFSAEVVQEVLGLEDDSLRDALGRARRRLLEAVGRCPPCPSVEESLSAEHPTPHIASCAACAAAREAWAEVVAGFVARRSSPGAAAGPRPRRRFFPLEAGLAALAFLLVVLAAAFHQGWVAGTTAPRPGAPPANAAQAQPAASAVAYAPVEGPYEMPDVETGAAAGAAGESTPATPANVATPVAAAPPPASVPLRLDPIPVPRPIGRSAARAPAEPVAPASWSILPVAPPAPIEATALPPPLPPSPPPSEASPPPSATGGGDLRPLIVRFRLPRANLPALRSLAASLGGALHVEEPTAEAGPPQRAFLAFPVERQERVESGLIEVGATGVEIENRPAPTRPVHVVAVSLFE